MSALHQSQPLRSPAKTSLLAQWAKWTEDSTFCVTSTFILSLLIALALAYFVQPLPRVHDEFSYLLAADAFGQWETSAETHPHWQHFESFHIIHQPRYASKYPPGQGLILALGNSLGHPIIGSCLATAFALAAVMWLVIGWIDKKHHGLAMLLLSTHPGIHVIWGQSYWSGCLAMGGSALLVGSLFRLTSKPNLTHSLLAGIGTSLLMITRPFEGFVLTAVVGIVILFRFFARKEWSFSQLSSRVVLPGLTVTMLAFGIVLVYNASVTGSVKSFPYQLHEDQYNWNQIFFWQGPKETKPEYRHETIAQFYENDVEEKLVNNASIVSVMSDKLNFAIVLQYLFFGSTFLLGGFGITSVLQDKRYTMPIVLIGFSLGSAFLTAWKNTHYAAPAAALVLMLAIVCFFTVPRTNPKPRPGQCLHRVCLDATHRLVWSRSSCRSPGQPIGLVQNSPRYQNETGKRARQRPGVCSLFRFAQIKSRVGI